MFRGTYTALVTPFRDGEIDEAALRSLIDEQVAAGIDGIVPCGSTGESATLSHNEHERVIKISVEQAAGKIKVIAGTGSNNTTEACLLTRAAAEAGADGALLISPYYNKPTQQGHIAHYKAVAESAELPLIVYNIPGRTGVNIAPETLAQLAHIPGIVGVKEASGSLDQWTRIFQLCPEDFCVLSGDDAVTLPLMAMGGHGVIGVVSNLVPESLKAIVTSCEAGNYQEARKIHYRLLPLMQALFLETNPIGIKAALAMTGRIHDEALRLPLTPLSETPRAILRNVLKNLALVSA